MKSKMVSEAQGDLRPLCNSAELVNGGLGVPFDVVYGGQTCRAFAIRFEGRVYGYLNRCMHVAMEMDWQPNRFFDDSGQWLMCATHGALYDPASGKCRGGPCRSGLIHIPVTEKDGQVYWEAKYPFSPVIF